MTTDDPTRPVDPTRTTPISGADLARLWRAAPASLAHAQSCACCGGTGLPVDAATLEADIIDYLALKYQEAGAHSLAHLIAERRTATAGSFALWLSRLEEIELPPADIARLKVDLATTLYSIR